MLAMFQDLVRHKHWANAALLKAIRNHQAAAQDEELRKSMHHILLADRFWLTLTLGLPFDSAAESKVPDSLDALKARFQETHALDQDWMARIQPADLDRRLESPFFAGSSFTVAQAMMQISQHSHGHRAQCSVRLRQLGGTPPPMDFILWLKDERPAADWS